MDEKKKEKDHINYKKNKNFKVKVKHALAIDIFRKHWWRLAVGEVRGAYCWWPLVRKPSEKKIRIMEETIFYYGLSAPYGKR